jgi:DNA-binding MarR family transcriptional regulator
MPTDIAAYPPQIRALVTLPSEALVWHALHEDPQQSVRTIASRLGIAKSVVQRALARLIAIGLVQYEVRGVGVRPTLFRVSGSLTEATMK